MTQDTLNEIEVSVVLPCLNEEEGIASCIKKIKDVFSKENLKGEIIVADNGSTDNSVEIAKNLGAKVVLQPVRGYGAAYLKGIKQARGKYIIIGDADDTYDFYEIPKFIQLLKEGYDLVMGSRFKGKIFKKAMPFSHRFIGNPIITWVFKKLFGTQLSDVLCGMRAFTKSAFEKMNLKCLGMEFGIEMILSALQKNMKIAEIPINYYPRKGKSKLRPFRDAWRYFRFMFLFSPTQLYIFPGIFFTLLGLIILFILVRGPFLFLGHKWDIHMMVLGSLISLLGFQVLNLGIYAKLFGVREGYLSHDRFTLFLMRKFKVEFGIFLGSLFFIIGFLINLFIFLEWWKNLFGPLYRVREAILALTLMVLGLQMIFSSFFISFLIMENDTRN